LFLELDYRLIPSTLTHLQEESYVYIRKCLLIFFTTSFCYKFVSIPNIRE
jgi:hypothetical protein